MSREEAEAYIAEALALAMSRDGSSGGVIRLVTVNKEGAHRRWVGPCGLNACLLGGQLLMAAGSASVCLFSRAGVARAAYKRCSFNDWVQVVRVLGCVGH